MRLSSALRMRMRPVRGSRRKAMSQKLVPVTFLVSGSAGEGRMRTKGRWA